jgi:hypothetical protein
MPASEMVEAQWVAERRGFERFRTEQPPYSILNRGIESEVLPVAQRYGMGTLVWSPLAKGMLTGRIRKGHDTDLRRTFMTSFSDEQRLDAVEKIMPLAEEAGLRMTHLAMAFAVAHPGVTSALLGHGVAASVCQPRGSIRPSGSARPLRSATREPLSARTSWPSPQLQSMSGASSRTPVRSTPNQVPRAAVSWSRTAVAASAGATEGRSSAIVTSRE